MSIGLVLALTSPFTALARPLRLPGPGAEAVLGDTALQHGHSRALHDIFLTPVGVHPSSLARSSCAAVSLPPAVRASWRNQGL